MARERRTDKAKAALAMELNESFLGAVLNSLVAQENIICLSSLCHERFCFCAVSD
jgi:hypothetical protein